jgi:hypothetical protein
MLHLRFWWWQWRVQSSGLVQRAWHFRGAYSLHLQGWVSQARNQQNQVTDSALFELHGVNIPDDHTLHSMVEVQMFGGNVWRPLSGSKSKLSTHLAACWALKMEALCFSRTLVKFYQATWHHIQEGSTHNSHCHESVRSYTGWSSPMLLP